MYEFVHWPFSKNMAIYAGAAAEGPRTARGRAAAADAQASADPKRAAHRPRSIEEARHRPSDRLRTASGRVVAKEPIAAVPE
jgi:hypothetical protein